MNEDQLKKLIEQLPEDELPSGHTERFSKRLDQLLIISGQAETSSRERETRLNSFQKQLIAASFALFITGVAIFFARRQAFYIQGPDSFLPSSSITETEMFYRNEIDSRIGILKQNDRFNRRDLNNLCREDKSLRDVLSDLQKNPGDFRLKSAIIETYQLKVDLLDEIIRKQNTEK
jgi:hypothetical protein